MSMLTYAERRHFESVPSVNPDAVGEVVGIGAQSVVRTYVESLEAQQYVIKVPLWQVYRDMYSQTIGRFIGQSYDSACRELDMCEESFGPYMVPTQIIADQRRNRFCILQAMLPDLETLTPEVCNAEPVLRGQLQELIEKDQQILRTKYRRFFDFVGWNTAKFLRFALQGKPYLDNVAVVRGSEPDQDGLRLFDYGIFPLPEQAKFRAYYRTIFGVQRGNLEKYCVEYR